jgi:hypothetical protein
MVHWRDAVASMEAPWHDPQKLSACPMNVYTVGWIVKESDDAIVVAQSIPAGDCGDDHDVGGVITIPKSCLVKKLKIHSV